jgi:phospholipid/cholesterol/gamma-HCH transport system substrate-binding protein
MSISASQRTRLGVFVAVGMAIGFLMLLLPLRSRLTNHDKTYIAYFSGESLSGLEEGAQVKFHGVPIGKIARISYDAKDLTRVKAEMRLKEDFPVKNDMYAQTGAMGITGLKYVEILGGTNAAAMLKSGSEIPTKPSMLSTITGKAEVIVEKIELLLNHLNQITEPDSLHSIKSILSNLTTITRDFRSYFGHIGPEIQDMSGSVSQLISRLDSIALDVKQVTAIVGKTVSGDKLSNIMNSADSAVRSIKILTETTTLMIKQSREDFSVSLQNLREALENAAGLMRELSENPSLILRNEQQKEREIK